MDIYEVIQTRRSVRKFRSDAIPKEKILRILEAANLAPTASNRQPWHFLIVDRFSLDEMSEMLDQSFKERLEEIGIETLNEGIKNLSIPVNGSGDKVQALNEFYRTFGGAPMAVVAYVDRDMDPWQWKNNICDTSAAIANLILAGWSEGIGSCWMTGPLKKKGEEIKAFLRIPKDSEVIGLLPLGIPAYSPRIPPKKDIQSRVKWFGL